MGEHFWDIIIPRMKKILNYDTGGASKNAKKYKGGGFFKYYELEQYEEALYRCVYADSDLFSQKADKAYQQYVFLKDEKMLRALEIDEKENRYRRNLIEPDR
jgi:adenine specific DNA methylase Mod